MRGYRDERGFQDDRNRYGDRDRYYDHGSDRGRGSAASGDRRQRSRSRSRSRERDRRDRDRDRNYDDDRWRRDRDQFDNRGGYGGSSDHAARNESPPGQVPGTTVMIKGLPAHTTEPALYAVLAPFSPQNIRLIAQRETGECKGFAFVEFYSVEYAQYFMSSFAGSAGDMNAPQLIVENRAVTLQYARDSGSGGAQGGPGGAEGPRGARGGGDQSKSDWLCDTCGCQNFARRMQCYRCSTPKGDNAVAVTANLTSDPFADVAIISVTPSTTLAVRGLPLFAGEDQVMETFRQFAPVKNVFVVRDLASGMSRGIAFVEFHSTDYAEHTLRNSSQLQIDRNSLKINFAKDSVIASIPAYQQQQFMMMQYAGAAGSGGGSGGQTSAAPSGPRPAPGSSQQTLHSAYAAAALQAAQWSAASYSSQQQHPTATAAVPQTSTQQPVTLPASGPVYKPSWPLNFDTNGASYVFQAQSGVFYDASQRYYYCPKSKLYYNEATGVYLCAAPAGSDHPYLEFDPPEPTSKPSEDQAGSAAATTDGGKSLPGEVVSKGRKPVVLAMKLGGKPKPKPIDQKVSADIAKWGERKVELVEGDEDEEAAEGRGRTKKSTTGEIQIINAPTTAPVTPASSIPSRDVATAVATLSTASACGTKCLLCRRQFASPDQLQRHERESKLHAENVIKAAKAKASAPASSGLAYRDRASERRAIYGQSANPDDIVEITPGRRRRAGSAEISATAVVGSAMSADSSREAAPVAVSEDAANPGNQLLRRMGWNEGKGLGKDESGQTESVAIAAAKESRAPQSKVGVGSGKNADIPALDYADDTAYKTSLMRATKARFDQVSGGQ